MKSPWSIFTKIERKQIALEQLSDMIGFRVIVPTVEDCYRALGIVHTTWKVVPGRFKDYISVPKHNDYRSIHTTIVGVGRQRAELQIRTEEMHRIAEFGIAAHALYKEGATDIHKIENESKAFVWLRSTISHLTAGSAEDRPYRAVTCGEPPATAPPESVRCPRSTVGARGRRGTPRTPPLRGGRRRRRAGHRAEPDQRR